MSEKRNIEIQINNEDVKAAFLQTAIQSSISDVLTKMLSDAWKGYETRNAIEKTIAGYIATTVKELIESKYKTAIKDQVEKLFTEDVVNKTAEACAEQMVKRLQGNY